MVGLSSLNTASGTTTGTPGSWSTSRRFTRVRKTSGEAFTTRLEIMPHIFLQLLSIDLARGDPGMMERLEERRARQSRQLSSLALGDQALTIPVDRRRLAHLASELLRRAPQRGENVVGNFNGDVGQENLRSSNPSPFVGAWGPGRDG